MYDVGDMKTSEMRRHVTPDLDPRKNADHLFVYKGVHCRQTRNVFDSLDRLASELASDPARTIVEVGTFHGAFTQLLRDHDISAQAEIHTFDIKGFSSVVKDPNVTYVVADCWSAQCRDSIKDLVQRPGRSLVFCDGDNKEKEVNTFCEFLKPGDLILCHDYVRDVGILQYRDVVGNWPPDQHESHWINVKDVLGRNHCEPFLELEMQRAMWGCFIHR